MFHKRLLKEFHQNRKNLFRMVLTQWIMLLANVVLMLQTADVIQLLLTGGMSADTLASADFKKEALRLLLVLAGALFIRGCMSYLNSYLSFAVSREVKERLRNLVFEKLMRLGSSYHDQMKTSEVVQISTEGVEQLEIYFGKYMPQFFYSLLAPLTLFVIVGTMSMKVAVVLLLCVPLIPVSIVAVQKFAKKMLAKYWGTYTELGDSFLECLQGLTTLKIYQADERYAAKMDEEAEKFRKVTMRVLIMQLNSISIMDIVAYGGAAVGIILSILEYQNQNITLAQCFFIIMISAEFFLPLRLLGSFFHIAMNGNAAADKIFRLLDTPEERDVKVDHVEDIHGSEITFKQVNFSYTEEKQILQEVSLTAGPGLTALVGESGCGKSTIVSLIMGEQQAQSGSVLIGEHSVAEIAQTALHHKITRIRHNSYLFAGTLRENLCMGKPDLTDEEAITALKKVALYDFVEENGGLNMKLLEKASNLSGGQKQRLALARAILHDTDIYLFDESASNVDAESENEIMRVVHELAKTKTVLLISHRLANVVDADMIYVIRDGSVCEAGTHAQLQDNKGYYHNLYTKQKELEQYGNEVR